MRVALGLIAALVVALLVLALREPKLAGATDAAVGDAVVSPTEVERAPAELATIESSQRGETPPPVEETRVDEPATEAERIAPGPAEIPRASAPAPEEIEPAPAPTASITGYLRHESGAFSRGFSEVIGAIHLDVSGKLDGERVEGSAPVFEPVMDEVERLVAIVFRFDGLDLRGRYEVTLSAVDHQRWSGPSFAAAAPSSGIEFLCFGEDESTTLSFRVLDDATGEDIEGQWKASEVKITSSVENGVLVHAAPLELDDFPVDAELDWVIEADGYAPAYGDRSAFDRDPTTGALSATVRLKRGFGARVIVLGLDPDRVLASGASVSFDGRTVGRTDGRGTLSLSLTEPPAEVEVEWRGQRLAGAVGDVLLRRRSGLLIALLEKE